MAYALTKWSSSGGSSRVVVAEERGGVPIKAEQTKVSRAVPEEGKMPENDPEQLRAIGGLCIQGGDKDIRKRPAGKIRNSHLPLGRRRRIHMRPVPLKIHRPQGYGPVTQKERRGRDPSHN